MKIGLFIGTMGAADTLQGQVRQPAEAEADGFDSFWTAQVAGVDALTLLALCGDATRTIEMGTAVVPTYPRHPMALAQQALTTQAATGGRLLLGIGLSHRPVVEDRWGMSFHAPAQHMDEYLTVLQSLMSTGSVDFHGEHFSVSGEIARMTDTPPSVCVAALAPRMLHIAGSRADGTITWMVGPRTLKTHIVPRLAAAAEQSPLSDADAQRSWWTDERRQLLREIGPERFWTDERKESLSRAEIDADPLWWTDERRQLLRELGPDRFWTDERRESLSQAMTSVDVDTGRPAPRVCVGLPICVTDDSQAGFEAASGYFQRYGTLPSYRRMLDIEGVESPAEVAIIGNEAEVEDQLKALASAGATDYLASIFPVGPNPDASITRTRDLLKSLIGHV